MSSEAINLSNFIPSQEIATIAILPWIMVPADNNYYFLFICSGFFFFSFPCKKMVFAHLPGTPNHHPTLHPDPSIAVFLEGSEPLCLVNHCVSQRWYQKRAMSRLGSQSSIRNGLDAVTDHYKPSGTFGLSLQGKKEVADGVWSNHNQGKEPTVGHR